MRRILVVDDDAHVGQAIGLWLKHNGFACPPPTVDPSGLAALDNATFDLMIVDVFFPGMRGFEAIRLFHQRAPSVPLVVIPVPPFRNGMVPLPIFSPGCDRAWRDARPAPAIQARDLLGVIDECLAEAEPHRRQIAALGAVAETLLDHEMAGLAGRIGGGMS